MIWDHFLKPQPGWCQQLGAQIMCSFDTGWALAQIHELEILYKKTHHFQLSSICNRGKTGRCTVA
jgi:hypothetical protein